MKLLDSNSARLGCAVALLATLVRPADSKVVPMPISAIAAQSRIIALIRVQLVEKIGGVKVARALVLRAFKGASDGETLRFIAQRVHECDISDASPGEVVLVVLNTLPLNKQDVGGSAKAPLVISDLGRAKFPVTNVHNYMKVDIWPIEYSSREIIWPRAMLRGTNGSSKHKIVALDDALRSMGYPTVQSKLASVPILSGITPPKRGRKPAFEGGSGRLSLPQRPYR